MVKDLIDRLSSYNVFNYLLPGVLFAVLGNQTTTFPLLVDNIVLGLFVYYFFGLVISRVGSLAIQPLLEYYRVVAPAPYEDFIRASRSDDKLAVLSQENNMYRTLCALFICLLLVYLFDAATAELNSAVATVSVFLFFAGLFALSYRKQTKYIKQRIHHANLESPEKRATTDESD